jgi:hypothetical protein
MAAKDFDGDFLRFVFSSMKPMSGFALCFLASIFAFASLLSLRLLQL